MQTIRKNAMKKIEALLAECILIREFRNEDFYRVSSMPPVTDSTTVARVMACGAEYGFERVREDDGEIRCSIHRNWSFTGYSTIDAARRNLTPQAFAKYFPDAV